jgi:hypothetical protein
MVPAHAFLPGSEHSPASRLTSDPAGYVDTGFACQIERNGRGLTVTAAPPGLTVVGGYRFRQSDVDDLIAQADPTATIVALPDVDLGLRLAGSTAHRDALRAKLQSGGINPLISGAFRPRRGIEAA